MKNLLLILTFFIATPTTILATILALLTFSSTGQQAAIVSKDLTLIEVPRFGAQVYAALPGALSSVSANASIADARTEIVRQYLEYWGSPLEPYADFIVAVSDQYNLDFRLITAIAQQESNLCRKAPAGSYNCWGWGIHSEGVLAFDSYPEGIQAVTQGLKEEYIDRGFVTIEEIMSKYTPLSNGSWAYGVQKFMAEME